MFGAGVRTRAFNRMPHVNPSIEAATSSETRLLYQLDCVHIPACRTFPTRPLPMGSRVEPRNELLKRAIITVARAVAMV